MKPLSTFALFTFGMTLALGASACSKDDPGAPASKGPAGTAGAKTQTVTIAKLGLKADVPAGATVSDPIMGDGAMIQGNGFVVQLQEASGTHPKTLAAAKSDAAMFSPNNLKEETLADGWVLTFDNTGSMGANYFVQVRRELGGKSLWCETTAPDAKGAQKALDACKSLKP